MAFFLVPALAIGVLGGATILAHTHGGHGPHVHAAAESTAGHVSLARHRSVHGCSDAEHGHVHPASGGGTELDSPGSDSLSCSEHPVLIEDPHGVLIKIPDLEQFASRRFELAGAILASHPIPAAGEWHWSPPDLSQNVGLPGGRCRVARVGAPLHWTSLSAVGRLVLTGGALLL